ncbi:hypothetical protein VC83_09222 [Pseudogymnoascus destructans]|uniref:Uncharacterized protein n=1 Tax=Pseudogymnoascus destructans TaxID=655981 RepID=A0A176ZYY3_9PEZI|nr:uncharacterized protein VC83_09222 [Pseudogymnoascus destructans]OAF54442.1 hypothetical protein VC83_09222 [Pseudogymnoascus destructans]
MSYQHDSMETPYYTENNNVEMNSSRVVLTRAASAKYESNISLPASDKADGHQVRERYQRDAES